MTAKQQRRDCGKIVPRVSQLPGVVTGYWTRGGPGGLSMVARTPTTRNQGLCRGRQLDERASAGVLKAGQLIPHRRRGEGEPQMDWPAWRRRSEKCEPCAGRRYTLSAALARGSHSPSWPPTASYIPRKTQRCAHHLPQAVKQRPVGVSKMASDITPFRPEQRRLTRLAWAPRGGKSTSSEGRHHESLLRSKSDKI